MEDRVILASIGEHAARPKSVLHLHGPAALVWICLEQPGTAAEIEARLREAGSDATLAHDHIAATLSELVRHDIIETAT
ncbi:MAG: hypothetical protein AAGF73_06800 [Actinomycetota bacterium]